MPIETSLILLLLLLIIFGGVSTIWITNIVLKIFLVVLVIALISAVARTFFR